MIIVWITIVLTVIYRFIQIIPENVGTGETKKSPDNNYQATAYAWSSESFWGEKRSWFEFKIEDVKSGNVVQKLETDPIAGPYFGSRSSYRIIYWKDDSSEVIFKFPYIDIKMRIKPEEEKQ
ncbi:MAG: hypothetical protein JXR97_14545 [Planctomycetes bacterium]|nr:hypothetical protein [Planctomycetota bacterium]